MKIYILLSLISLLLISCSPTKKNNEIKSNDILIKKDSIYIDSFFNSFIRVQNKLKDSSVINMREKDKLVISEIKILDNISKNDIFGFSLTIDFKTNSDLEIYKIHIKLFKDGLPINSNYKINKDNNAGNRYVNNHNQIEFKDLISRNKNTFFIPYNTLELPKGQCELEVAIQISVRDNNLNEVFIPNTGITKYKFKINQPQLKKLRIGIKELKIKERKANGKKWDKIGLPDLRFKIYLSKEWKGETIYRSPLHKEKYSCKWSALSNIIFLDPRDWFCIYIVDYDPAADDTIAWYSFTYSSFLSSINSKYNFQKGQISHILISYEDISE